MSTKIILTHRCTNMKDIMNKKKKDNADKILKEFQPPEGQPKS